HCEYSTGQRPCEQEPKRQCEGLQNETDGGKAVASRHESKITLPQIKPESRKRRCQNECDRRIKQRYEKARTHLKPNSPGSAPEAIGSKPKQGVKFKLQSPRFSRARCSWFAGS